MKKILVLSLVASFGGSSLALAHGGGKAHFARMDADGDGQVTQQEFLEHKLTRFDAADANGDGQLTEGERKQAFKQHAQKRFEKKDADDSGELSLNELGRMPQARFTELDTDGSGGLSPEELKAGFKRHHKRGRGMRNKHKRFEGTMDRAQLEAHASEFFTKLDDNGDQVLTADEMMKRFHKRGHGKRRDHGRGPGAAARDAG